MPVDADVHWCRSSNRYGLYKKPLPKPPSPIVRNINLITPGSAITYSMPTSYRISNKIHFPKMERNWWLQEYIGDEVQLRLIGKQPVLIHVIFIWNIERYTFFKLQWKLTISISANMKPLKCTQLLLEGFYFLNAIVAAGITEISDGGFHTSIGLSALDAQTLSSTLQWAKSQNNSLVNMACKTARLALPKSQVSTAPLNQTIVHENWYELFGLTNCSELTLP